MKAEPMRIRGLGFGFQYLARKTRKEEENESILR
jgi:hypothetical protein